MKKLKITYWIFTGLFAAFMFSTAIPDVMNTQEAQDFITKNLGYPAYFTVFIGWAKMLGVLAILVPGFPRIKEWAYAGLTFDLLGAVYSILAIGSPVSGVMFFILPLALEAASYIFYHKLMKASSSVTESITTEPVSISLETA